MARRRAMHIETHTYSATAAERIKTKSIVLQRRNVRNQKVVLIDSAVASGYMDYYSNIASTFLSTRTNTSGVVDKLR